jgi:phosphatidate cytidylyltransferase
VKSRIITALVVIPVVLATTFYRETWPLALLGGLVIYVGGLELSKLLDFSLAPLVALIAYAASTITILVIHPQVDWWGTVHLIIWLNVAATAVGSAAAYAAAKGNRAAAIISVFWLTGPISCVVALHAVGGLTHHGTWFLYTPLLIILLPLWAGDTAAIFAGMAFGKTLLAPKISPKKTLEGAIANLIASIAVALWVGSTVVRVSVPTALLIGAAVGIFGQGGDLFESWLKRRVNVKDSGNILPGHGGILDRIDSLLWAAPAVAAIFAWLLQAGAAYLR